MPFTFTKNLIGANPVVLKLQHFCLGVFSLFPYNFWWKIRFRPKIPWFKSPVASKLLYWRQPNVLWYERTCMAFMKTNLRFLRSVDRERCLLEVGRIYGQFVAILTTVHWPQAAQGNTRYVPSRYIHHILQHIGHWGSFGNNWWSTISSLWFRSVLRVDLTHLNKPSVQGYLWIFYDLAEVLK